MTTDLQEDILQILQSSGIDNEVDSVIEEIPDLKGKHFASTCSTVVVKFKNSSILDLHLFVKKESSSKGFGNVNAFEKERRFYMELLKDMAELWRDCTGSDEISPTVPKVYGVQNGKIVLENLSKQGYSLLNAKDKLDMDATKMILSRLAIFHATSYVMLEQMGLDGLKQKHPFLAENVFVPENSENIGNFFNNCGNAALTLLRESTNPEAKLAYEAVKHLENATFDEMSRAVRFPTDLTIISHGDMWCNNVMFLRSPDNVLLDAKLLDWQVPRIGSPSLDIAYLFTSLKPDMRRKHREQILKFYFNELCSATRKFGIHIQMPFDKFLEDFKMNSYWGFMFVFINPICEDVMANVDAANEDVLGEIGEATLAWAKNNPDQVSDVTQKIINIVKEFKDIGCI